ncbi:MAG: hypothetical protein AB7F99_06350 [Vicinamibacterales bacterium]
MDSNDNRREDVYEAPQVEQVLTPEELVREVQYAGAESEVPADGLGG